MSRWQTRALEIASGRNVLLWQVPSLLVYCTMIFYTIPAVQAFANGMKLFDLMPGGYGHGDAMRLLAALGEGGRDAYLTMQLPLDFIYPLLFALSSCLLLAWLLKRRHAADSPVFWLCLVPVAAGLFDYLENIQIIMMLQDYPDISIAQVKLASAATVAKSGLTTLFFLMLVVVVIRQWLDSRAVVTVEGIHLMDRATVPERPADWCLTIDDLMTEQRVGRRKTVGAPELSWARAYERSLIPEEVRFPARGDLYEAVEDMTVTFLTAWKAPFTGSGEGVLQKGERIWVSDDPVDEKPLGVYALPVAYAALEARMVPQNERTKREYNGFYFFFNTLDLHQRFTLIATGYQPE